ncbi:Gfo/Idh/MocA family protein [Micromonospora sp. NPDC050187]|uniref:Gfo/Idh/MocA family protein n=1 Tax=Micromonospora sp. NPDC050187 TaxID=3364277 RepID=UPI0037B3492D
MSATARPSVLGVAVLGCGYVADFYGATLPNHPQLRLVGAFDPDGDRLRSFCARYGGRAAVDERDLLTDPAVDIVLNLTPPAVHDEVNRRVLAHGRHLYCEKPLALRPEAAFELVALARERGVLVGGAPCSVLGESARTLWQALRDGRIGTPRLVYAELDNGPLPYLGSDQWFSARGVPWPTIDELATGCTWEHAAYYVSWVVAMFGPVLRVESTVASVLHHEWPAGLDLAPDFSVGVLRTADGVVCRITCGWVAPSDLSFTVVGDQGVLRVEDAWSYRSPVLLRRRRRPSGKQHDYLEPAVPLPFVDAPAGRPVAGYRDSHDMDVSRGVAELADAVLGRTRLTLDAATHAHITEVCALLAAGRSGGPTPPHILRDGFDEMATAT